MKVLIVEQDQETRVLLKSLELLGHEVHTFISPILAKISLKTNYYDTIILDYWTCKIHNACDLAKNIDTNIIVMTTKVELNGDFIGTKVSHFLLKPFCLDQIENCFNRCI